MGWGHETNARGKIADKILLTTDTNASKLTLGDHGIKIPTSQGIRQGRTLASQNKEHKNQKTHAQVCITHGASLHTGHVLWCRGYGTSPPPIAAPWFFYRGGHCFNSWESRMNFDKCLICFYTSVYITKRLKPVWQDLNQNLLHCT